MPATVSALGEWTLPMSASCRCGALTLTMTAPPVLTTACHCRGCQKMTGGAFSLSAAFPADAVAISGAEAQRGGIGTEGLEHMHCPRCLSWVYTRLPEAYGIVNIRAPMIDMPGTIAPFAETQAAERLPFVRLDVALSFERFPDMEEFARASARFADEAPRM